jgi:formylglycine-generating enzyme required for sulfatase activity
MKQLLPALFLLFFTLTAGAQSITNVQARQAGKVAVISYDLNGPATESYQISLYMSKDNGNTWLGPLKTVRGNVGSGIKPGNGKKITWEVLADYEYITGNVRFKVKAKGNALVPPKPIANTAIEPEMVFVQGGTFIMGSPKDAHDIRNNEKPCHEVQVSSFYMGKYEVTYGEFKTFVAETGYRTDADEDGGSYIWNMNNSDIWNYSRTGWQKKAGVNWKYDAQGQIRDIDKKRHPVIHVSWNDAQAYISWLNQKTGKNYRLPTEAEWEYAARGGVKSQGYLYSGSNSIGRVAWYTENSGEKTHPVGQKQANELGIFDMAGNVWEWCQDWYDAAYYAGRPELDVNPQGPSSGQYRVIRGGSWTDSPYDCRVANRLTNTPDYRNSGLGFRLALPSR